MKKKRTKRKEKEMELGISWKKEKVKKKKKNPGAYFLNSFTFVFFISLVPFTINLAYPLPWSHYNHTESHHDMWGMGVNEDWEYSQAYGSVVRSEWYLREKIVKALQSEWNTNPMNVGSVRSSSLPKWRSRLHY